MNKKIADILEKSGLQPYYDAQEGHINKFAELLINEFVHLMESERDYYKNPATYESSEYYARMAAKADAFDDAVNIVKSNFGVN